MYKAVFSDFDGTLLTSEHKISPKTQAAIERITAKGIPFVPISARSPKGIWPYADQLGVDLIVAFSGALILNRQGEVLYSVQIAPQDVALLNAEFVDFPALATNYYFFDDCVTNDLQNRWVQYEIGVTHIEMLQGEKGKVYPAHKIQVIGEPEEILQLENRLKAKFPHLSIHRSLDSFLEIMEKSASKGQAVRFLESYLNVTTEQAVAFGDNFNDLDMLENVGLGVAMANAPEAIKAAANRVTASNNEDGIALVLNEVFE